MARQRSALAKEKLLAAAAEVLLETGVNGFTVDEVARRSGVAKTTIYRHFESGQELLIKGMDSHIAPFPTPNTGSLRGDIEIFCETTEVVHRNQNIRRLFSEVMAAAKSDPELARIKAAVLGERFGPVRTIVELAMARGEIPADINPEFASYLVQAPFMAHMMLNSEPPTDDEIGQMVEFVVRGLGARP